MARRLHREARLGASLNHPNLVSVFDTETYDEGVLIVMEYVEGETLGDALRRGPLPMRQALDVIRALAAALDHAHSHGVVHRDVKPGNVLLGPAGVVKLADLGIGIATDNTRITRTGIALGTPAYMAPEQIEAGRVTPAADVYALGALSFELLSGRKALRGREPAGGGPARHRPPAAGPARRLARRPARGRRGARTRHVAGPRGAPAVGRRAPRRAGRRPHAGRRGGATATAIGPGHAAPWRLARVPALDPGAGARGRGGGRRAGADHGRRWRQLAVPKGDHDAGEAHPGPHPVDPRETRSNPVHACTGAHSERRRRGPPAERPGQGADRRRPARAGDPDPPAGR